MVYGWIDRGGYLSHTEPIAQPYRKKKIRKTKKVKKKSKKDKPVKPRYYF